MLGSKPVSGAVSRGPSLGPCLTTCEAPEIWFTWGAMATAPAPCLQPPWESPPPGRRNALPTGFPLWVLRSSAIRMGWTEIDHAERERPAGGPQSNKGTKSFS